MSIKNTPPENKINQAKTRLLLALFVAEEPVTRGKLNKKVVPRKEEKEDYQRVFDELVEIGAIKELDKGKSYDLVPSVGLKLLDESLKHRDFENNVIGTWVANGLLKLIRQNDSETNSLAKSKNQIQIEESASETIASYDKFKDITLEVYEELNRDEKLNNLVPIYQIRRKIGNRVNRKHFDSWLLDMQANDILQLQGGSLPDNDPTKIKDSIETELSGLRCYAKLLNS